MTRSQKVATDIAALLRARNPLLWIVTREEGRAERYLFEAAAAAGYIPRTWDVGQGTADMAGNLSTDLGGPDPGEVLGVIKTRASATYGTKERGAWIMRDLHTFLTGPVGAVTCRQVRNLARLLPGIAREQAQAMMVITPSSDIPPELAGHATVIEWPLPDREEIAGILDAAINSLPDEIRATAAPNGTRDAAIDAAIGLTGEEAAACYARSLVQTRRIDPTTVAAEKKRVITREKVLEWVDPVTGGMDAVGGLENLKAWLVSRAAAYTPKAREYGLPRPRGAMLVGVPGCGKSLTAKAVATAWGVPLLKLDLGALKGKYVGESEGNLRRALGVIEAMGRCVVWVDEIEKGLQGATSGSADGGVSADALGTLLSWMQERAGEAFVIATANNVEALPPELMRKGRFDDIWWIDLPTAAERKQILAAALKANGRDPGLVKTEKDKARLATCTKGFTGSEVAELVIDALYAAYADGAREIKPGDIFTAATMVTPLSVSGADKIKRVREFAGRARPASKPDEKQEPDQVGQGRAIDL